MDLQGEEQRKRESRKSSVFVFSFQFPQHSKFSPLPLTWPEKKQPNLMLLSDSLFKETFSA